MNGQPHPRHRKHGRNTQGPVYKNKRGSGEEKRGIKSEKEEEEEEGEEEEKEKKKLGEEEQSTGVLREANCPSSVPQKPGSWTLQAVKGHMEPLSPESPVYPRNRGYPQCMKSRSKGKMSLTSEYSVVKWIEGSE